MESYLITKPDGTKVVRQGETKFHAIAILVMEDKFRWSNTEYTGKKIKIKKTVIKKPTKWL